MGSLSLRPGDSLTVPRTALSVGFIRFVSSTNATQATGFRLFPRWDSPPTEHASLSLVALCSKKSSGSPVGIRTCYPFVYTYETSALFSARRCFASVHSDVLKAPFASAKLRRKGTKSGGHFSHICSCAAQNACSGLAAVIGPGCRQVNELSPFWSGRFGLRRFLCLLLP